eukprot:Skav214918  [mRNA]  locus=scaffold2073:141910:143457:- [translate_table: standard]
MEHPLFLLAARLGIPTATAAGDFGCQYCGWESAEIAEWHDCITGEEIPTEEILDAVLLLQQVTYGMAVLAADLAKPTAEVLFQHSLQEVLQKRVAAQRRSSAVLTSRERALLYKIRGRHFGYVAPCSRMPPITMVSHNCQRAASVFQDGHWPHSEKGLREAMLRLWQRKFSIIRSLPSGAQAEVVEEPQDHMEDRLLLGGGFRTFIDCFAESVEIHLNDPVKEVIQDDSGVRMKLLSGKSFRAALGLVTVPSGVLAELHSASQIHFQPPLPLEKLMAIRRLSIPQCGACTHEKVLLRWTVADPFVSKKLDPQGAALQFETTDARFHFLNLHKYGRSGQLLCHIWGDSRWEEHKDLTDEEVVLEVVKGLRAMFADDPKLISFPPLWKVTRWSLDPFALGAYTEFQDVMASEDDRDIYMRTEGRLFFAGEGAVPGDVGAQCTHGAVFSGASAAVTMLHRTELAEQFPQDFEPAELRGDGPLGFNVAALVDVLATGQRKSGALNRYKWKQGHNRIERA